MLKIILIAVLLISVRAETKIDNFLGTWLPVITYPDTVMIPICEWNNISLGNEQCKCGDRENVPVLDLTNIKDNDTMSFPVVVVDTSSQVMPALRWNCICGDKQSEHLVFRYINDNYFVQYELQSGTIYQGKDINTANVFVKKMPTLSQLEETLKNIDDLSGRKGGLLCPLKSFVNENL